MSLAAIQRILAHGKYHRNVPNYYKISPTQLRDVEQFWAVGGGLCDVEQI
jgi:hypothetical protein